MSYKIPIGEWVAAGVKWLETNDHGLLDKLGSVIQTATGAIENGLMLIPFWLLALVFVAIGYWRLGWKFALFCAASFLLIDNMGFANQTVVTLALIISATLISLALGIPLGIWAGRNDRAEAIIRPILDFMQTMPAFVYLIPAAMACIRIASSAFCTFSRRNANGVSYTCSEIVLWTCLKSMPTGNDLVLLMCRTIASL